ncbi:Ig-like domain-containing protein [Amphritea pacifica]|uniref:Cadherin-like domain-containing protein n=1 Tax=Amphritea pacifica TaxID=2811233 RepID=A0ABS2W730_9GAMM|nr:Ig-like domain-containing protein [Amphritea pacifica]MBN0987526.1 cadherin-like domain-containing protein [Amphritea pacifica]
MNILRHSALLIGSLMLTSGTIQAATYDLCVGETQTNIPSVPLAVRMWGYGIDTGGTCNATVPGPQLDVPVGDTTLTINLRNTLPNDATSVMIPGQGLPSVGGTPVTFTDPQGRDRIRSFVAETAPGTTGVYTWNNIKPGTYPYQSGTHVQVQVQMGLYGAMIHNEAVNTAYPGVTYDQDKVLIYSAIDPVLHEAVNNGEYGANCANPALNPATGNYECAMTSTIVYKPKYFLVNGATYNVGSLPEDIGPAGSTTLLRMINMNLDTLAPMLLGDTMDLVAESGYPYPYPRRQYSVNLAPGQSKDGLVTLGEGSTKLSLFDRRLNTTIAGGVGGGLVNQFTVSGTTAGLDPLYYFSMYSNNANSNLTMIPVVGLVENRDVVSFNAATGDWAMVLDGSSYNLVLSSDGTTPADIDALHVFNDGRMMLSFADPTTVPGLIDPVGPSDLVIFNPANVGSEFSIAYTGAELGLTTPASNIDALSIDVNGDLQISTRGSVSLPGVALAKDEDVIRFSQATRTWSIMFDGSDLSSDFNDGAADIDALTHPDANQLLFSILLDKNPLVGINAGKEDVLHYSGSFGLNNTTGLLQNRLDMSVVTSLPNHANINGMSWSSGTPYVNSAPLPGDDNYNLDLRLNPAGLTVAAPGVLANDSDPDMNTLSVVAGSLVTDNGGSLVIAADGSFTYTPVISSGVETATYTVEDSYGGQAQGTITITVETSPEPVNEAPVGVVDNVSMTKNTSIVIDVLANDTDSTGFIDPSTVYIKLQPINGGIATVNPDGTISFTPATNFVGTDVFRYRVYDNLGLESKSTSVRVNVTN